MLDILTWLGGSEWPAVSRGPPVGKCRLPSKCRCSTRDVHTQAGQPHSCSQHTARRTPQGVAMLLQALPDGQGQVFAVFVVGVQHPVLCGDLPVLIAEDGEFDLQLQAAQSYDEQDGRQQGCRCQHEQAEDMYFLSV